MAVAAPDVGEFVTDADGCAVTVSCVLGGAAGSGASVASGYLADGSAHIGDAVNSGLVLMTQWAVGLALMRQWVVGVAKVAVG